MKFWMARKRVRPRRSRCGSTASFSSAAGLSLINRTRFSIGRYSVSSGSFSCVLAGKWGMNNFYLYRLQHQAQHRIIAWDDDLTFLDPAHDVTSFQEPNVLVKKLMEVPEYRGLYFETLAEAVRPAKAQARPRRARSRARSVVSSR